MTTNDDDLPTAAALRAVLRDKNMITWLEFEALKLGTDNQRERHAAGVLPTEELTALARGELYKPLENWGRWHNKAFTAGDVRHRGPCHGGPLDVKFTTTGGAALPPMEGTAWEALKALRHAVNKVNVHPWLMRSHSSAQVDVTRHQARCELCRAQVTRYAAKVIIPWGAHILVREYVLSVPAGTVPS